MFAQGNGSTGGMGESRRSLGAESNGGRAPSGRLALSADVAHVPVGVLYGLVPLSEPGY